MDEWKVSCNARIMPETRAVLEEFAAKEHRSLGKLCFVLLTWATEQLQKARPGDGRDRRASIPQTRIFGRRCTSSPGSGAHRFRNWSAWRLGTRMEPRRPIADGR